MLMAPSGRMLVRSLLVMQAVADAGVASALELPSYRDDEGNELVPCLSLEAAIFPQSQFWFGRSKENLGSSSATWLEQVFAEPGWPAVTGPAPIGRDELRCNRPSWGSGSVRSSSA